MIENLKEKTKYFIELCGFEKLTNVQSECLQYTKEGDDIVCISPTGTGKTHAFLIPIVEKIDPALKRTQAIISVPTRELALQLYENAKTIREVYPDIRIRNLSGGTDTLRQKESMKNEPQIVIGTPGRLKDLYESGDLRVDHTAMFVIDEADMTLEFGFLEDIDKIFFKMVNHPEVLCFSATMPEGLKPFIKKYLNAPKIIEIKDNEEFNPDIKHILVNCRHMSYEDTLMSILDGFKPYVCMVFASSREDCEKAYDKLKGQKLKVGMLHGGLETRERKRVLKALMNHEYTYLVATDVASRGLDIKGVSHVVSLGLPSDLSFYTHRSGRTGRSGNDGVSYLLFKESDQKAINSLKEKGISFTTMSFKNGVWREVKKRVRKESAESVALEKEIAKTLHRKKEKVKPNYKKKKAQAVKKIKQKKRQEFIRQKIKEEKKERYRQKAKE